MKTAYKFLSMPWFQRVPQANVQTPGTTSQEVSLPSPGIKKLPVKMSHWSELHYSLHCNTTALTRHSKHSMEINSFIFILKHFHAAPEERSLTYWGCSSLKHSCDNWGAGLHSRSAAVANASQPRGLTSENICSNFLKCQVWKRTITMSTYNPNNEYI